MSSGSARSVDRPQFLPHESFPAARAGANTGGVANLEPPLIVAGLTGSIAMGKSTVAEMFAALGWPVFDADAAVRAFYAAEGAAVVEAAFPGVAVDGVVDRNKLAPRVLNDAAAMAKLEAIVHPAVARYRRAFLHSARESRRRGVVLDIPLLFETGGARAVDIVVVVSAGHAAQRARALARPGMTPDKFDALLARQIPDAEKRRRAHYVIDTSGTFDNSRQQVADFCRAVVALPGRSFADA